MKTFPSFLALIFFDALILYAAPHLPQGTKALPSAAERGRGPLALVNLNHHVLGYARVFGGERPDLFVIGFGGPQAVHLFRWIANSVEGAPVFTRPIEVKCQFKEQGSVLQLSDGRILGFWVDHGELVVSEFHSALLEFRETSRRELDKSVRSAASLGVLLNDDNSFEFAFEVSDEGKGSDGHPWTEEWRPSNSSGISNGSLRYRYLMGMNKVGNVLQISATKREVYFSMHSITSLDLGADRARELITGSRQGNLIYYHNKAREGFQLDEKRLIAGEDGVALRHPSINPSVTAYPNSRGQKVDIIACGEGSLYYYRFTGKFAESGAPIYESPIPVLQEEADLYAGTLPSPTTIDWNGDGRMDILVGNSEGFVLYFENIGSNDHPRFLPATRVQAGGREIQVQAGYSGSLQGLQESRWGYLSPNVFDWNGDSLPDMITGDITGDVMVYINRGTPKEPKLDSAQPLYCDGIPLHGMWRVRPAVANLGSRIVIAIVDGEDHFHLYRRIDDQNLADDGKLLLEDGTPIGASGGVGGMSGRCKLDFFDWNQDTNLDLVIGTNRVNSIPDRVTGLPMPTIGTKTLGTPLLMLNLGTNEKMSFARPVPFRDELDKIIQPGGAHETGAVGTMLGKDGPNLLICNEAGRMFLLSGKRLRR